MWTVCTEEVPEGGVAATADDNNASCAMRGEERLCVVF